MSGKRWASYLVMSVHFSIFSLNYIYYQKIEINENDFKDQSYYYALKFNESL